MKNIFLLLIAALFFSCSSDDKRVITEEVNLFVDHYKTTSVLNGTAFVIFENGALGNDDFKVLGQIDGLVYEPGFIYQLTASKIITQNPGTDAKTVRYQVISVTNREAARPDAEFRIPLIEFINGAGYATYIRRQADSTFILGNQIPFNCNYFCVDLDDAIQRQDAIIGTFTHGPEETYVLQALAN